MPKPEHARRRTTRQTVRRTGRTIRLASATALVLAFAASTALAAHFALTLGAASNATLGEHVIVSSSGRTLYTLSPETSRHLLCKTSECLRFWPPLTVSSAKTKLKNGAGVQGHLALLRRSNGAFQVTLRGMPLYRYSKDHARSDANGEGIESFGGTWHAMTAAGGERPHKAVMTPATPSPPVYPSSQPTEPGMTPSPPAAPTTTPTTTPTPPPPPPYEYPKY